MDDGNVNIKLTDFGFATKTDQTDLLQGTYGSLLYMAPEILKHVPYGKNVDIWSASVLIYILLCGEEPFSGENKTQIMKQIKEVNLKKQLKKYAISDDARQFLEAGLKVNPDQRPTALVMLGYNFVSGSP